MCDGRPHLGKPGHGFGIEQAVTAGGAKAALEGAKGRRWGLIGYAISDRGEVSDRPSLVDRKTGPRQLGSRPNPDAGAGEPRPIEQLAGVCLAVGCYVRVPYNPVGRDRITRYQGPTQALYR